MNFGEWVKTSRKQIGMTLDGLAERVPCSKSTLWGIENELATPSLPMAALISCALGTPLWRALKKLEDDDWALRKASEEQP